MVSIKPNRIQPSPVAACTVPRKGCLIYSQGQPWVAMFVCFLVGLSDDLGSLLFLRWYAINPVLNLDFRLLLAEPGRNPRSGRPFMLPSRRSARK